MERIELMWSDRDDTMAPRSADCQKAIDERSAPPYHEFMAATRFYFASFYYYGYPSTGRGWRRTRD